jgi:hypothetical protein
MRPKLQKRSALKLAGRIIPEAERENDCDVMNPKHQKRGARRRLLVE